MDKVHSHPSGAVAGAHQRLEVPSSVPEIEDILLQAAMRRSPRARRLDHRLREREACGKPLSAGEVKQVVADATGPDGKPDGDQAIVVAEHARKHPEVFGGAHGFLLRFLARVEWQLLFIGLRAFIAELHEATAEEQRRLEAKKDRERDRLVEDDRRPALLREERVHADAQPAPVEADEELTATNRLRLTMERMKRR